MRLGGSGLNADIQAIAAPKFQWDAGLKQADQMVQLIQKNKLAVDGLAGAWQAITKQAPQLAEQQAKLSQATATPLGNNQIQMYIPAKNDINDFNSAMDVANRTIGIQGEMLQSLGTKLQDWGKNTQWAGRQMMVGFTVPFLAMAAASASYAYQIDQDMSRIEKVYSGSTQGLQQTAMATANVISQTMGQSADSTLKVMYDLASAGKQGQELQQATIQAQTLATLGNIDQETAVKSLIAVQNIFRLSTQQTTDAVNYLNAVEAATPSSLTDIVNAVPIAGQVVKAFGGTLQDTTILLSAFRENGISTVEGANAIKTSMARLIEPTKAAQQVFQEFTHQSLKDLVQQTGGAPLQTFEALGSAIDSINNKMEQQQVISTIFGKQQYSRMNALISSINEPTGAVAEAKNITDQGPQSWAATTLQHLQAIQASPSTQFNQALQSFKNQFQVFGDFFLKTATGIISAGTDLMKFFNGMPTPIKDAVIAFGALLAIAGPLTMVVGLLANFGGAAMKFVGSIMRVSSGYKSMTVDQKAAQLMAGEINKSMLTEADTAQVLVYQLDKLVKAYTDTGTAAKEAAAQQSAAAKTSSEDPYAGMAWFNGERLAGQSPSGQIRTNRGRILSPQETDMANQVVAMSAATDEADKTATAEEQVAANTSKAGAMQKIFSQQSLLAGAAVTGIASAVMDGNSGMSQFLNYMSDALIAATLLYPMLQKSFALLKDSAALQGLASAFNLGNISGMLGKATSAIKSGLTSVVGAVMSPMGLGIIAVAATAFTVLKTISDNEKEQAANIEAIANSTNNWMETLGKTAATWGQIRDASGQVQNTTDSMVEQMRQKNATVVNEFSSLSGSDLQDAVMTEMFKLQGQGLNSSDVTNSLQTALQAAGKSASDIQNILGNLKANIDFSQSKENLDTFVLQLKNKLQDAFNNAASGGTAPNVFQSLFGNMDPAGLKDISGAKLDQIAKEFVAGATSLDPTERAYVAKQLAQSITAATQQAFQSLAQQDPADFGGKSYQDSISKYLQFTPGKGYGLSQAATPTTVMGANGQSYQEGGLPSDTANKLQQMAQSEYDLAQKIAGAVGITGTQLAQIKSMNDLLPLMTTSNQSAADVQKQYNQIVQQATDSGNALTTVQKDQLAQMFESVTGLNAAALEANRYDTNLQQTQDQMQQNQQAAVAFAKSLQDTASAFDYANSASSDFWSGMAASDGSSGFSQLGGQIADQAKTLSNAVKTTYQNAQDQIMKAFADQAQTYWQNQLDAIKNKFEAQKTDLQNQMTALSDAQQVQSQNQQDQQKAETDAVKDAYNKRVQATNDYYKAQTTAIDNQIKQIQDQQKAEQNLDQQRQQEFQNEQNRLQRLAQLQTNQIDYVKNIASGNLDEAAKVMVNSQAQQGGWRSQDAQQAAQDAYNALQQQQQAQLDALNDQKSILDQQKQDQLQALQDQETALEDSLQRQQTLQQRALQNEQKMQTQALQNKLNNISTEEQAATKAEQDKQKMNQETLDIELNSLKTFIPQNEQQLNDSISRIEGAYGKYGVQLTTSGDTWGQIIGNALQTNVDNARMQIAQDAAWSQFGTEVSNAITQGAFGMSLQDFFNMLETGQAPQNSPLNPPQTNKTHNPNVHAYHTGGLVGTDPGGRLGISGPLTSGEIPAILQKGEYVLNQQAVQNLGSDYLSKLNAGQTNQIGMTGIFAGAVAGMMRNMIAATILQMGASPSTGNADLSGSVPAGATGPVQNIVRQVAATFGWDQGAEWAAINALMMQESGWNPNAQNPTSTAYGLFQFLDSTWAGYGIPKTSDPGQQALAGFRYIKSRYNDPIGAENFHLAHNWYDIGGILKPGATLAMNATGKNEAVLTNQQWKAISTMTDIMAPLTQGSIGFDNLANDLHQININTSPIAQQAAASINNSTGDINVTVNGTSLSETELKRAIRDGIIEQKVLEAKRLGKIK